MAIFNENVMCKDNVHNSLSERFNLNKIMLIHFQPCKFLATPYFTKFSNISINFFFGIVLAVKVYLLYWPCLPVFMDRPLECDGGTFSVADDDIFIVEPREPLHDSRPPNECIVSFKSYDSSSDQGFEVVVESAQFHDCSMELQVYKGSATAGAYEVGSTFNIIFAIL